MLDFDSGVNVLGIKVGVGFKGNPSATAVDWVAYGTDDTTVLDSGTYAGAGKTGLIELDNFGAPIGKVELSVNTDTGDIYADNTDFQIGSISV